jgi:hypothetical protein
VTNAAASNDAAETRSEAAEAIRGLIDAIVLTPVAGALEAFAAHRASRSRSAIAARDSGLQIELRGNLAAMLTMATRLRTPDGDRATARFGAEFTGPENATRSPDSGDLVVRMAVVAGARNRRYQGLWVGAA